MRPGVVWYVVAWAALLLLPWSGDDFGFFTLNWLKAYPAGDAAPAVLRMVRDSQFWLLPFALPLVAIAPLVLSRRLDRRTGTILIAICACGIGWLVLVGFSVGLRGWTWELPQGLFGPLPRRNAGFGCGAFVYAGAMLSFLAQGFAARGAFQGSAFACGLLVWGAAFLTVFAAYPLSKMGISAFQAPRGQWAPEYFWPRFSDSRLWRLGGVVPNTILLGLASAASSTLLALAFGLITERTNFAARRVLRTISILPIITPPFVVGLSVILLMGRNGSVNHILEFLFGIPPTRWIYGFQGVWFAQTLSFTPIAYLVFIGILKGLNPVYEEAAQTLRASNGYIFGTITLPLLMPGLANAFLVVFAQSLADFGNPLLLGGDFQVLATSVYFAIVGARADRGVAAVLGLILLVLMLVVFLMQRSVLGGRSYTTISGKGVSGQPSPLPIGVHWGCLAVVLPWALLTLAIYGAILFGGFVENWGLNNTLTLRHYRDAFGFAFDSTGLRLTGQAWDSFATTSKLALIAAPITAAFGICLAYLINRHHFRGKGTLEVTALIAGSIPGTVLGIAYVLAFNNPPLELVQTAAIIVISFVVRNMGPGFRASLAGLKQIDRSLDEASATLRASGFTTVRRIILPLMRPVLLTGLIHGFVAAMTTVSAVIFLVSPGLTLVTVYVVNLAEAGTYGVAIATSSALLLFMLAVILLAEALVGERRFVRTGAAPVTVVVART
jgi:iron(III) transport system permease protein